MDKEEYTGELLSGATLSYFSEEIGRDEFDKSHTELKQTLFDKLKALLPKQNIRVFDDPNRSNGISVVPDEYAGDMVDRWNVFCNFLEKRGLGYNNRPYLQGYRILLTFKPHVKDEFRNKHSYTAGIMKASVSILDSLGQAITATLFDRTIEFSLLNLDQEIETASWKVVVAQENSTTIGELMDKEGAFSAIRAIDESCRNKLIRGNISCKFLENVKDDHISKINSILGYTGFRFDPNKYGATNLMLSLSKGEMPGENVIFSSFLRESHDEYPGWKEELIKMKVVSQNVIKIESKASVQMMKLEVLHKLGLMPLELDVSEEAGDVDGFLYLTRVSDWLKDEQEKQEFQSILGASLVYGGRTGDSEESILTINDPRKEADEGTDIQEDDELIHNTDKVTTSLVEGLSMRGLRLNIIITRKIPYDKVSTFVKRLDESGISVNKIFYFSRQFSTSPSDPERLELSHSTGVSYKILSQKHLFYQPSQRLLGQFDLGTVYSELIYPAEGSIEQEDVVSLIRLSKRRLYRLYSIPSLRIPEPIVIFKDKSKMIASLSKYGTTIPLRMLI